MKHRTFPANPFGANPVEHSRTRSSRHAAARDSRRSLRLISAFALMLGSTFVMALPASAAPGDPIVMPDDELRACINDDLGQGATDPITEAQADAITEVTCPNMGITDITGLEMMPNLENVQLQANPLTSRAPLTNLTNLVSLSLGNTGVTEAELPGLITSPNLEILSLPNNNLADISALSSATSLRSLILTQNNIADLSVVAGLSNLTYLNIGTNQVSDLSPVSGLTGLTNLTAHENQISDLSPVSSLTSLTNLTLQVNEITDITPLSGLTTLTYLNLNVNQIADVSPLSTLTSLTYLRVFQNEISDISPLSTLSNLTTFDARYQSVSLPSVPMGAPTINPVTEVAGNRVPVTSTDSGFSYDTAADTWTFSTTGAKTLNWNTTVSIGTLSDAEFHGTITQFAGAAHVVPEDPAVTQAFCQDGDVVYPEITLPDTEGITYGIVGDVEPGATITIETFPADVDHVIYVDPNSDWVDPSGDHIYASLEITLDDPDCSTPVTTVDEEDEDASGDELVRTGGEPAATAGVSALALLGLGGLLVLAGRLRRQQT